MKKVFQLQKTKGNRGRLLKTLTQDGEALHHLFLLESANVAAYGWERQAKNEGSCVRGIQKKLSFSLRLMVNRFAFIREGNSTTGRRT